MPDVLTVLQGVGVLAVLAGVALLLPLGGALVVNGALVLLLATAAERIALRRPSAPPDRRSGADQPGVE